jgi:hypothetical protein
MIEEDDWWRTGFSRPLFMLLVAELRWQSQASRTWSLRKSAL